MDPNEKDDEAGGGRREIARPPQGRGSEDWQHKYEQQREPERSIEKLVPCECQGRDDKDRPICNEQIRFHNDEGTPGTANDLTAHPARVATVGYDKRGRANRWELLDPHIEE